MSTEQVIERLWDAPLALIWELWTTAGGIESWFGPKGFAVEVHAIDLRVGGTFRYTMRAASPQMVEAMRARGQPVVREVAATFTAVDPPHRLAYDSPFGPEIMRTSVTFAEEHGGVRMVLVIGSTMPDAASHAARGWDSSLERLEERLAADGARKGTQRPTRAV